MNNQAKTKLEQLKKLNLPEKAKATLGLIEKLFLMAQQFHIHSR